MAARSIGSGTITFGLVSIPIRLFTAVSEKQVSFNTLHATCKSRLKQQLFCPVDNVVVEREDTVRGYEYARDQYVTFSAEEYTALEAERTNTLDLEEFVPLRTVDPLYVKGTQYLGPDKGGARAYALLARTLAATSLVGVGRFRTRGRDALVLVAATVIGRRGKPVADGLVLHQCYYADEVRALEDVEDLPGRALELDGRELQLARQLVEERARDRFDPQRFHDTWKARIEEAVRTKIAGGEIIAPPSGPKAQVLDLVEALERSVKSGPKKAAPRSSPTRRRAG